MNDASTSSLPTATAGVRWTARILSALVLLVWGFFIVAYLFGEGEEGARPLDARDYVGLITMGAWLVGLAVSWKWEFIGGVMTLAAYAVAVVANPAVLLFPFVVIPVAALLFLASWRMHRSRDERPVEAGTGV